MSLNQSCWELSVTAARSLFVTHMAFGMQHSAFADACVPALILRLLHCIFPYGVCIWYL